MKKPVLTAVSLLCHLLSSPQVPALPPLHIVHVGLQTEVDDGLKNGVVRGEVQLSGRPEPGRKVMTEVRIAANGRMKVVSPPLRRAFAVTDSLLSFSAPVAGIRLWSAETPVVYDVQVRLTDSSGAGAAIVTRQVAFRRISFQDSMLLVNNHRVRIKGISLAWPDSVSGQTVSERSMLEAIRRLKTNNINTVRAPHRSYDAAWYALCDQYGLYVVDDANTGLAEDPGIFSQVLPLASAVGEIKQAYQPVLTSLPAPSAASRSLPGVAIRIFNDHAFRDLSHLSLEWKVLVNGVPGQRGIVPMLNVGAQQSALVRLPARTPAGTGEILLDLAYRLKKDEGLLPAGHIVAMDQLPLRQPYAGDIAVHPAGELTFTDEGGTFSVSAPATSLHIQFNKQSGWLQHYVVGDRSLLEDTLGLSANFWRTPTMRDYAAKLPQQLSAWKEATREPKLQLFSTSTATDIVVVRADYFLPETFCSLHVHYTINAKGEMQVEQILEVDSAQLSGAGGSFTYPMLPRFGMRWFLPAGYDSVAYYGRGPQENYEDRCRGAFAGIHRQSVEECGTRTGVRWWKIIDQQGHGLLLTADSTLLSVSALHYYDTDLDNGDSVRQRPAGVLKPRPQTQLNIDLRQMGIAGGYQLPFGNYHYIYKVTPF
jgi:beta-galactosidase/beta-glucuronidase